MFYVMEAAEADLGSTLDQVVLERVIPRLQSKRKQ